MMKTVQEYFDDSFKKSSRIVKCVKADELLEGYTLNVEGFPDLESLDVRELEQVNQIIIKNCPKLRDIHYSNQKDNSIIVQPEKKGIDWPCILGISLGVVAISVHVYKYWQKKKK